jgi:hypothetical protein
MLLAYDWCNVNFSWEVNKTRKAVGHLFVNADVQSGSTQDKQRAMRGAAVSNEVSGGKTKGTYSCVSKRNQQDTYLWTIQVLNPVPA